MKKIRDFNGNKVAFIEKYDIKTLLACRDFVKKEIFEEPSIVYMECDAEGFYRIDNPSNVEYIAGLGYILDYDIFTNMSKEEVHALADKAIEERHKINKIIEKLCVYKQKLTLKEKRILKKAKYLDYNFSTSLEHNVLNASLEATRFSSLKQAILAQTRNYTNALVRMSEQKDTMEQQSLPDSEIKSKKI